MNHNLINFCENDKNAVKSYCTIHNETESKNLGDITKVDIESLPKCDMITHGSPCQDFSVAGLQAGADEGTETRSSLIWNSVKIIQHCEPKFVIWENVKNVLNKKHIHNFEKYLHTMEELGYANHYKVLNAKDYGVPQNRERIFCISIRKDIDCGFEFPTPFDNGVRLQDIVESGTVDRDYSLCIARRYAGFSGSQSYLCRRYFGKSFGQAIFDDGAKPSDFKEKWKENEYFLDSESPKGRIRQMTPSECFSLMGFSRQDCEKCEKARIKKDSLYSQAGNSIVVNTIAEIYKQLQKYYPNDFTEGLSLISLFSGIGAFEKAFEMV